MLVVFQGAYPILNPKASFRIRVRVRVTSTIRDYFFKIIFKDESLKTLLKRNLFHLISKLKR